MTGMTLTMLMMGEKKTRKKTKTTTRTVSEHHTRSSLSKAIILHNVSVVVWVGLVRFAIKSSRKRPSMSAYIHALAV